MGNTDLANNKRAFLTELVNGRAKISDYSLKSFQKRNDSYSVDGGFLGVPDEHINEITEIQERNRGINVNAWPESDRKKYSELHQMFIQ